MTTYDPNQSPPPWNTSSEIYQPDTQTTASGDRWGLVALTVVITTLIGCIPLVNCLAPFIPLVVGLITLSKAKTAVDPSKARLYGWLATGLGILFILFLIAIVAIYGALIVGAFNDPAFRRDFELAP